MKPALKRVLWAIAGAGVAYFAIQGGEYGTSDLIRELRQRRQLTVAVDSVHRIVDSLQAYKTSVETDPKVQERIARENFGMIKSGETMYMFDDPDTIAPSRGGRQPSP